MPKTNLVGLDEERRREAANYELGYDWIEGRFGPPPGIPRAQKEELDNMSDEEYLRAFVALSQELKESLMVSEAERRRTFAAHWPIEAIVKGNDCAREGFYYTGVADKVQCVVCGGILKNWERGNVPKDLHKKLFGFCMLVKNKPCPNIPVSSRSAPSEFLAQRVNIVEHKTEPTTIANLNINTIRPKHQAESGTATRLQTYDKYPKDSDVTASELCSAGFKYAGDGDRVSCFWCGGELEKWRTGDDPWLEHAKWYPGCTYLQQMKGFDYIRQARRQLNDEELQTAQVLEYNKGDISFIEEDLQSSTPIPVEQLNGFKICLEFGYSEENIRTVYEANGNIEFKDQAKLVELLHDLVDGNTASLDEHNQNLQGNISSLADNLQQESFNVAPTSFREVKVREFIEDGGPDEASDAVCSAFNKALTCKVCHKELSTAAALPCGCWCMCRQCSLTNVPPRCPVCHHVVKGACRTNLNL